MNKKITKIIEDSWSSQTSRWSDTWNENDPSWGQCDVTALLVQDYLGGIILCQEVRGIGFSAFHYWNEVNGKTIDIAAGQIPPLCKFQNFSVSRKREDLLKMKSMNKRYSLLKTRVDSKIAIELISKPFSKQKKQKPRSSLNLNLYPSKGTLRFKILNYMMKSGPVHDEKIAIKLKIDPPSARRSRHELCMGGWIEKRGVTSTLSGRAALTWTLTNDGKNAWESKEDIKSTDAIHFN